MNDRIVSLVDSKEEVDKSFIQLTYNDGEMELTECDSFGEMEGLPGFIAVFKSENQDFPPIFYRSDNIKKIEVFRESELRKKDD